MVVNEPAQFPESNKEEQSNKVLLHEPDSNTSALPCTHHPQMATLYCAQPPEFRHCEMWVRKLFADRLDIFYMYAEMDNNECAEMRLKFPHLPNPSVFATTPKVDVMGLKLTAANHAAITQKFRRSTEQYWVFAQVVRLKQNRIPHRWQLNTGPNCYENRASDLHQLSRVPQLRIQYGLMSRPNTTLSMKYQILECSQDQSIRLPE
jgi:hypothetical protein